MISLAYAALWIFVFSMPWDTLSASAGVVIVTKVTGILALGLTLLAVMGSGQLRRLRLFHVAALLFVIWAGFGLLILNTQGLLSDYGLLENQRKFYTYVQLLPVLWMVWELAPSRSRALGLLTAYVFGCYVAAFGTFMVYRRDAEVLRRFAAGGGDPNDMAMTLVLALPMAWYLGMTYRQPLLRWACRAYLPVGLVALGLTGSRGGFIATMVALLIVPFTMGGLSAGRRAIAIALLVVSGALAVKYVPQTLIQRLASTGAEVEEGQFSGRLGIWRAGMKAFTQKPLIGYGTAGFREAVRPWTGQPRVAHNSFLSVLVEQGMVGFLLFSTMFVAVFRGALGLPSLERRFALVLLATLGVTMLPLTWEAKKAVWFILAALLALCHAQVAPRGLAELSAHRSPARAAPMRGRPVAARHLEP